MQVSAHGDPGTVRRAEAGVENDMDKVAVKMYAAPTPRNVEDMLSLSPILRDGMTAHAVQDMKHN